MERSVKDEDVILQEDLAILERDDRMGIDLDMTAELHIKADRLSVAWRRMMAALDTR